MAKAVNQKKITNIKAGSWAAFQGTFAAIIGLGVAILHSIDNVAEVASSTDSVLAGLAFGLATGVVSIVVLPLVYFALGWVFGWLQAWAFNIVLGAAGGISIELQDD